MDDDQLSEKERAIAYCADRFTSPDFANLLGTGQEGSVWPTHQGTAIKVFERRSNFQTERACYEILAQNGLFELDGFTIPHLVDSDESFMIVKMTIASPPFILDFGKAYINRPPDFDELIMREYREEREEWFEGSHLKPPRRKVPDAALRLIAFA